MLVPGRTAVQYKCERDPYMKGIAALPDDREGLTDGDDLRIRVGTLVIFSSRM
jgi:hypothetical protein